jgi:H+/gluconate symporter-like permease
VDIVCLVLGTPLVLDVVVFALLALHDSVDASQSTYSRS